MLVLSSKLTLENLPVSFVERYRTSDTAALKVAIFLMLGNPADASLISEELSLPLSSVERSLHFWHRSGLLVEEISEIKEEKKTQTPVEIRRLSEKESKLLLRNPEIAELLRETQNHLGRVITPAESIRLMGIYQYDELPVEVILMIIAFSAPRALKNLFGYVEKVARVWKEDGIDTIEKAEKHLALIEKRESRYREIALVFGVSETSFTFREKEYINAWFEEYGYDAVFADEALERTATKTVPAVNRILKSWSIKGYTTIKDTRSEFSNTGMPVPQRRKSKKDDEDDLFVFAEKMSKTKRRVINS